MPKIEHQTLSPRRGCGYPAPFDEPCEGRARLALSDQGGLSQFGAHLITLKPGAWSSQRHHHSAEDEFVFIVSGTPTFVDDEGEQLLHPGDSTAHPAGDTNGHHLINRSEEDVAFLVVGARNPHEDSVVYPDIDLALPSTGSAQRIYRRNDGTPY